MFVIEIWGVPLSDAKGMRDELQGLLTDTMEDEFLITLIPSAVTDEDGETDQFARLYPEESADVDDIQEVIITILKLGLPVHAMQNYALCTDEQDVIIDTQAIDLPEYKMKSSRYVPITLEPKTDKDGNND
jgi:hypothetical protein